MPYIVFVKFGYRLVYSWQSNSEIMVPSITVVFVVGPTDCILVGRAVFFVLCKRAYFQLLMVLLVMILVFG